MKLTLKNTEHTFGNFVVTLITECQKITLPDAMIGILKQDCRASTLKDEGTFESSVVHCDPGNGAVITRVRH